MTDVRPWGSFVTVSIIVARAPTARLAFCPVLAIALWRAHLLLVQDHTPQSELFAVLVAGTGLVA